MMAALFVVGFSAVVGVLRGPQAEHVGERQPGAERADLEEVAAVDAVAIPLLVAPEWSA